MKKVAFLIIVVLILGLGSFYGGYLYLQKRWVEPLKISNEAVVFDVEKGQSLRTILTNLQKAGIIDQRLPMLVYIRSKQLAGKIQVGEYKVTTGDTIVSLTKKLVQGDTITHFFRITEGITYKQMLDGLQKVESLKRTLTVLHPEEQIKKYIGYKGESLEGQFYPDTYAFKKGDTDLSLLKRAHHRLNKVLKASWLARDKSLPLKTPYEALILASIVEKETAVAEERPVIAGVFIQRLTKHMRLQTDPTVIYGLGDRFKGNLTKKHLRERTAYNTYKIKGLPPTPIALVGKAAIEAVMHPKITGEIYFVAKGDGSHAFSKTLAEHRAAVRKYQLRKRVKNYRSTPK